jgi:hypothetical protein
MQADDMIHAPAIRAPTRSWGTEPCRKNGATSSG